MTHASRIELQLRLADAADMLENIPRDDDGLLKEPDQAGTYLTALEQALNGEMGCLSEEEFHARRSQAYMLFALKLGFE
jgi:hypothetical protein